MDRLKKALDVQASVINQYTIALTEQTKMMMQLTIIAAVLINKKVITDVEIQEYARRVSEVGKEAALNPVVQPKDSGDDAGDRTAAQPVVPGDAGDRSVVDGSGSSVGSDQPSGT
jgi:hypothetical protein